MLISPQEFRQAAQDYADAVKDILYSVCNCRDTKTKAQKLRELKTSYDEFVRENSK